MKIALNEFKNNLKRLDDVWALYHHLKTNTTLTIDYSDLLRYQLVMVVSSLDSFMHRIIEAGIIEIFQGIRPESKAFVKFPISMTSVNQAIKNPNTIDWLRIEIQSNISHLSYQHSDKISVGLKLISDLTIWEEVSKKLNIDKEEIKTQLNLIVDRRNNIVHAADVDPTFSGKMWFIDEKMVQDSIDFIDKIVDAIYSVIK